ncbi:MAG: type II secretion system F family protein [Candidatus Krumholzibacteria bacterium]|nr:type II secretion system F family protein [Candidatus Krumholzibacteria bacterium]MDH4336606.1 type II secretion system F family protein [Candidatus Krumholzibacteria bacterium]MDH5268949.1 type II secretion system F family protein [Candidatus Krumholzibacteria bacterium]
MATTYTWKGRSPSGELLSGEYATESKDDLVSYLRKRKIIITSVREKGGGALKINLPGSTRVSVKDIGVFTRQFATMINAGLPMVQCLDILAQQTEKVPLREAVAKVMSDVEGGSTLAEGLARHPKIFSNLFVNMVEAGEAGGILDVILVRLATFLEKLDALQRKVKSALTYPSVVGVVALGATAFMLIFIIPTFAKMFTDFGGDLPLPTRIVIGISDFLRAFWWALLAAIIGIVVGLQRYYKTSQGRLVIDKLLLKIPVLGMVIRKGSVARFTRTLGTLISSGVPILSGLEITARTSGNRVVELAVMSTRESISQGNTIAEPLKACGVFPPMVTQMISVGEQTGALDEMLDKIANFYDDEVDTAVDSLTAIIEPVMIVVMGTLVGGMLIAMYLPMFKLVTLVGGD